MDLKAGENDIFRVPFSARFKLGSGMDLQFLSYHARFSAPIAVGGGCGFECLEKINFFLNSRFHKKGAFLKTLDNRALKFLRNHLDYLNLKKSPSSALFEENGPVIRFKYSKPRVYSNLIEAKDLLKNILPEHIEKIWERSYKDKVTKTDKNKIQSFLRKLFDSSESYELSLIHI